MDILQYLPPHKKTPSGWYTFNCPACIYNGETPDKRHRGGLKFVDGGWIYHCFNCHFKTGYTHGKTIPFKVIKLLHWLGVDENTINKIKIEDIRERKLYNDDPKIETKAIPIAFEYTSLPEHSIPITEKDTWAIKYLESRHFDYQSYPFKITPEAEKARDKSRIIIPFYYDGQIVGWSARYTDKLIPKYISSRPSGFVFNLDRQKKSWDYLLVMEGLFDALSIGGVAIAGNSMSEEQAALIRSQGKEVIIVPDINKAGMELLRDALKYNFSISLPDWEDGIIDVNDAVKKYGKIGTLLSILTKKYHGMEAEVMLGKYIKEKKLNGKVNK